MRAGIAAGAALITASVLIFGACSGADDDGASASPSEDRTSGAGEATTPAPPPASREGEAPAPIGPASDDPGPDADRLALGRDVYMRANCAMCHAPDGTGGPLGPDLTGPTRHHHDGSVEEILAVLKRGIPRKEFVSRAYSMSMPPATNSVEEEGHLRALAEYVRSLGGERR